MGGDSSMEIYFQNSAMIIGLLLPILSKTKPLNIVVLKTP